MSHGSQQTILAPISKNHLGTFGRMAAHVDVWVPKDASGQPMKAEEVEQMLIDFANHHMIENEPVPDSSIPAGYTYLGQFIDRDITHDPTPLGTRKRDPEKIHNSRTPALDLDSVYGAGPDESPFMYSADGSFIIGQVSGTTFADLPRASNGKAIIGDKRNDENAIVAQVHSGKLGTSHGTIRQSEICSGKANCAENDESFSSNPTQDEQISQSPFGRGFERTERCRSSR